MCRIIPFILILFFCAPTLQAENYDMAAIKATAYNYMDSWYQGDKKRMKTSLHKRLAKRSLRYLPSGKRDLRHTKRSDMVAYTGGGVGKALWRENLKIEVVVLDFYQNIASVKVVTPDYYEYLHLAKMADKQNKWIIINAIYEPNLTQSN